MPIVKIMQRRQVVIPKELFEKLHLEIGDYLEAKLERGRIVYIPKKLVDRDEWYWSEEGQQAIAEALQEIAAGKVKEFEDVDDLIEELDS
jgi:AbrB family looped-hinge helix DNA binding protein